MTTGTMTVDTGGEWLVALSTCSRILVSENAQTGTAAWTYQAPLATSDTVTVPAGAAKQFTGNFQPGSKVALLAAASGSMTFTWQEDVCTT